MTKHDRVGNFHHGGFNMQRKHHAGVFTVFNSRFEECTQRFFTHVHAVDHFAVQQRQFGFQHGLFAFLILEHDAAVGSLVQSDGLL